MPKTSVQTRHRYMFDLANPSFAGRDRREVAEEIAYHLAHINRFCGAVGAYNVAHHSCLVASLMSQWGMSESAVLSGLLHDAHEAYCGDLPTPAKRAISLLCKCYGYDDNPWLIFERQLQGCVEDFFGVDCRLPSLKRADQILYSTEARDLHHGGATYESEQWYEVEPLNMTIVPWNAESSYLKFLELYDALNS